MAQINSTNEAAKDAEATVPVVKKRRAKSDASEAAGGVTEPVNTKAKRAAKAVKRGVSKTVSVKRGNGAEQGPVVKVVKKRSQTDTKASIVLNKLNSGKGVTLAQVMEATGWQAHSVRGFFSAVVKKKMGLNLVSETGKDKERRYKVVAPEGQGG